MFNVFCLSAFGTDAHSPDPGQNNNRNPAHSEFLPNGVVILEFVANLDMMPATGSRIFIGAFKVRDGSGGPVRIFAIYGDDDKTSHSAILKFSSASTGLLLLYWIVVLIFI